MGGDARSSAGKVTAGLAESNDSLPPGGWLQVTCRLTACTPGSAPGPTLGNEYGRTLPFLQCYTGWAKKVIHLVHYITLYERYHFFGPPCTVMRMSIEHPK